MVYGNVAQKKVALHMVGIQLDAFLQVGNALEWLGEVVCQQQGKIEEGAFKLGVDLNRKTSAVRQAVHFATRYKLSVTAPPLVNGLEYLQSSIKVITR